MDVRTLRCLNSQFCGERKCIDILERDSENIYAKNIENEKNVNLELGGFKEYLFQISLVFLWRGGVEESFHPYKLMWYIELYFIQNNMYFKG
jgi:hypothetical protein